MVTSTEGMTARQIVDAVNHAGHASREVWVRLHGGGILFADGALLDRNPSGDIDERSLRLCYGPRTIASLPVKSIKDFAVTRRH
jgi:hypothetical protein